MSTINWQQAMAAAKNASFEPLPDGEYDVVCIEATPTESSTNKPMIRAKYQVESGPNTGKKVFTQYTFSADNDNALSIFFQQMAFHGLDAAFFSQNPPWESVAGALMGKRVRFRLGTREWQGQQRNNVERVMPAQSPAPSVGVATPMMQTPQPQFQQPVPQMPPMQQQQQQQQPVMQPAAQAPMQQLPPQQPVQQPQMPTAMPQQPQTELQTQQVGPFTVLEQVPVQQPVQQAMPPQQFQQPAPQAQPDPNQPGVGGQPVQEQAPPQPDVPPAQPQAVPQQAQEGPALPDVPYG